MFSKEKKIKRFTYTLTYKDLKKAYGKETCLISLYENYNFSNLFDHRTFFELCNIKIVESKLKWRL